MRKYRWVEYNGKLYSKKPDMYLKHYEAVVENGKYRVLGKVPYKYLPIEVQKEVPKRYRNAERKPKVKNYHPGKLTLKQYKKSLKN